MHPYTGRLRGSCGGAQHSYTGAALVWESEVFLARWRVDYR